MKAPSKEVFWAWAIVVLWMGTIFYLSSIPKPGLPDLPMAYLIHKIAHFVEYSILGFLLVRAFIISKIHLSFTATVIVSMMLIVLFAASDEWHQSFVPGRNGCVADALGDIIYAALGVFVYGKKFCRMPVNTCQDVN